MNDGGDYRTAPATPGLLNIYIYIFIFLFEENESLKKLWKRREIIGDFFYVKKR